MVSVSFNCKYKYLISDSKIVLSDSEIKAFDSQFVCFFFMIFRENYTRSNGGQKFNPFYAVCLYRKKPKLQWIWEHKFK